MILIKGLRLQNSLSTTQSWENSLFSGAQGIMCRDLVLFGLVDSTLVKNLPAMQETPVQFLGQEDTLEKG